MAEVELMLDVKNELGEGPLWSVEEQAFYWVDINGEAFFRYDPATEKYQRYDIGQPVGTIVPRAKGGVVLALRDGLAFYDLDSQKLSSIVDPEADKPQSRFNDGSVDRRGRFWAGTMSEKGEGALYRLDTDLSIKAMVGGISISNGIGWSPDNKLMYYTDSAPRQIYVYDFDDESGEISNRRIFAQTEGGSEGVPDGLTVDSEGYIWGARWDGWKIVRYDPSGKIVEEVAVPASRVTSLVFAGANLDELYITTARTGHSPEELEKQPLAGGVFRYKPGVTGIPETPFAG